MLFASGPVIWKLVPILTQNQEKTPPVVAGEANVDTPPASVIPATPVEGEKASQAASTPSERANGPESKAEAGTKPTIGLGAKDSDQAGSQASADKAAVALAPPPRLPTEPVSVAAAPTSADKEHPFSNSLGMRFVPVPITGGRPMASACYSASGTHGCRITRSSCARLGASGRKRASRKRRLIRR